MKNLKEACHLSNNFRVFCFLYDSILGILRYLHKHPWDIFPTLHVKKQTRREKYHKANLAQYKDLNWGLSG